MPDPRTGSRATSLHRRPTATSTFGVGRRESHDASDFYRRFTAPVISDDDEVCHPDDRRGVDQIFLGDVSQLPGALAPASVALVVTSPPYYSGKEYEAAIGMGSVPASYTDYLAMLTKVLGACAEVLEPGGRMAVNVANLGRKPYRSLSADVVRVLEEDLGLLLRGEIIWHKAKGATGSCAWGTYQRPGDPVLRDLTERVVVASKGRFDRAITPSVRAAKGYPSEATIFRDEFLDATLDVWELPPESARRVGHPAPFPVELPQRLIDLYTYRGDLVLDPFVGSGTSAVAAVRTGRHFAGFDTDPGYVAQARARVAAERERIETAGDGPVGRPSLPPRAAGPAGAPRGDHAPAGPSGWRDGHRVDEAAGIDSVGPAEDLYALAVREGRRARELARWLLEDAGFTVTGEQVRLEGGVDVGLVATDRSRDEWLFDVAGAFTSAPGGLRRTEALWRSIGKATVVRHLRPDSRYVVMTTEVPSASSAPGRALAAVTGPPPCPILCVIGLAEPADRARLRTLARHPAAPA